LEEGAGSASDITKKRVFSRRREEPVVKVGGNESGEGGRVVWVLGKGGGEEEQFKKVCGCFASPRLPRCRSGRGVKGGEGKGNAGTAGRAGKP